MVVVSLSVKEEKTEIGHQSASRGSVLNSSRIALISSRFSKAVLMPWAYMLERYRLAW